jgi:hypothetical protein
MYITPTNIDVLFTESERNNLYFQLIEQTNKDFALANEPIDIPNTIFPELFKEMVLDKIYYLIQHRFDQYLNLLYIIDIPETEIKKLNGNDTLVLAENVSFLILKRIWQKVWFRANY